MIVDDEPDIRLALRVALSACGYEVLAADSADTALEQLSVALPDFVLLDVHMPGQNGLDTCRSIRARCPARIIMMAANSSAEETAEGVRAGVDDWLRKPFSIQELLSRLRG